MFGLALEHFVDKIVQHVAVSPGEQGNEASTVRAFLESEGRQVQPCNPTLGFRFQCFNVICCQVQSRYSVEKRRCFGGRKTEIGDTQFCQVALGAQACHR